MRRPLQVWLAFAACAAVAIAALAWLTREAVHADLARSAADLRDDQQRRINLALWRMDTKLAPLLAAEAARPAFYYDPLLPAVGDGEAIAATELSPLTSGAPADVLLNFVVTPAGEWTSPQAPARDATPAPVANVLPAEIVGENRTRLGELARQVDVDALLAQLPVQPLAEYGQAMQLGDPAEQQIPPNGYFANGPYAGQAAQSQSEPSPTDQLGDGRGPWSQQQAAVALNDNNDLQQRSSRYQVVTQQELVKQRRENPYNLKVENAPGNRGVVESVSRPVWVGDELLLARRVQRGDQVSIVGSWLDWPAIRADLLAEANDLLPNGDLVAVTDVADADPSRMLAGIPAMIEPREKHFVMAITPAMKGALAIGWTALVVALAAVAALLAGVLALSERRAAFVSAVTHELRTPLTTFRMYSEMLAGGMVPSDARRQDYLTTLSTEADRLTRLVENVLSYARLERGRGPRPTDRLTVGSLIDRMVDRLRQRAAGADLELVVDLPPQAAEASLLTDAAVVEQILFNLVDNAAKYAGRAADRRIHLNVRCAESAVRFAVRDHGPGFSPAALSRGDAPFRKSAQEAAETAPGVGLGLALCRRLAKQLGGSLQVESGADGAIVTLSLPGNA